MDRPENLRKPYALRPGQGQAVNLGVEFVIKAGELSSGSGAAVLEYTTRPGEEPDDHVHPSEDEMFYVLSGRITFRCGGEQFDLEPGSFIFLPRGLSHGYTIPGPEPVRLLVITAPPRPQPGGWAGFAADLESAPD